MNVSIDKGDRNVFVRKVQCSENENKIYNTVFVRFRNLDREECSKVFSKDADVTLDFVDDELVGLTVYWK